MCHWFPWGRILTVYWREDTSMTRMRRRRMMMMITSIKRIMMTMMMTRMMITIMTRRRRRILNILRYILLVTILAIYDLILTVFCFT